MTKMNKNVEVESEQGGQTARSAGGACVLSLRTGGERISQLLTESEVEALIFALQPFAQHKHRWVTDEDGVVHPCECGAEYGRTRGIFHPQPTRK